MGFKPRIRVFQNDMPLRVTSGPKLFVTLNLDFQAHIDGWIDGWTDGRTGGWIDKPIN